MAESADARQQKSEYEAVLAVFLASDEATHLVPVNEEARHRTYMALKREVARQGLPVKVTIRKADLYLMRLTDTGEVPPVVEEELPRRTRATKPNYGRAIVEFLLSNELWGGLNPEMFTTERDYDGFHYHVQHLGAPVKVVRRQDALWLKRTDLPE